MNSRTEKKKQCLLKSIETYCTLNGLLKNKNDSAIVTAFRAVVTVAARVAPHVRTNVNTN